MPPVTRGSGSSTRAGSQSVVNSGCMMFSHVASARVSASGAAGVVGAWVALAEGEGRTGVGGAAELDGAAGRPTSAKMRTTTITVPRTNDPRMIHRSEEHTSELQSLM